MEVSNYVPGVRRKHVTPLYDTYTLAASTATATLITLFGSTAGSVGIQKTNMTRAFELAAQQRFTMRALRVVPIDMSEIDLNAFYKNYCLQFKRGTAFELEAPMEYWAGGAGIQGAATTTATTTTIKQWTNGNPDPRAIVSFGDYPIIIEAGDHFEVNLAGASFTSTGALFLRVYLDGEYEKGVQ